ncbi:MAG TPA: Fic family protein [Opitutales bacterium]|nr:Fic family protein [Opitutales bacterium]
MLHLLGLGGIELTEQYLRWDELSRGTPPEYLVTREWWLALKLQRLMGRQDIGFKDGQGRPFTLGSVEFFAEAVHRLDRGETEAAPHPRSLLNQLAVRAWREEAIASVQLDGIEIDPATAQNLLRSGRAAENSAEQAVLNCHQTLARIREICLQPLTLALLADLQQRLTARTGGKTGLAGRLRQASPAGPADNAAAADGPPPAEELPARLKALLAFANGRTPGRFVHPLLRAAALHFWVLHDQPFAEGNGRLARALYYWSVLHAGYAGFERLSLAEVFRDNPAAYRRAFGEVAQDENDLLHFVAPIFEAIAKAQRRAADEAQRMEATARETAALSGAMGELNTRQRLLVARALQEPGFRRTLQEHARDHNLVRQTARNDFTALVQRGWFEEAKSGRALAFFPAPDLAARLQAPANSPAENGI